MNVSRETARSGLKAIAALLLITAWLVPHVLAVTVTFSGPNTTVLLGQPYLEFNNPLSGSEMVNGRSVLEWRDAGYACSGGGPPNYEDWTVSPPCVTCACTPDGYANEIWLRSGSHSATTTTTIASPSVSIHLHGDSNDGPTDVFVDGSLVATVNMFTNPGTDRAIIIVDNLPIGPHTIVVDNLGSGDTAIMGAAVLGPPSTGFCNAIDGSTTNPAPMQGCPCPPVSNPLGGCDIAAAGGGASPGVELTVVAQTTSPNGATLMACGLNPMGAPTTIIIRSNGKTSPLSTKLGDGINCLVNPVVRLGASTAIAGCSTNTFGNGALSGPGIKHYQMWFRSSPSTFCDPFAASNVSSGISLTW